MTTPFERTRALVQTKAFLQELMQHEDESLRNEARRLLRHYPALAEIELAHLALPQFFGPVPPFSRLSGSADVRGVLDATVLSKIERE